MSSLNLNQQAPVWIFPEITHFDFKAITPNNSIYFSPMHNLNAIEFILFPLRSLIFAFKLNHFEDFYPPGLQREAQTELP